ncbi:hypothetical protein J4221_01145 [Candidatus Pacearchaeota archaeon]|nr:hypothetical protein [Candidatus Pacearchaeota archaeon]
MEDDNIQRYRSIDRIYTTGEIARIWEVSIKSVIKCIDSGHLKAVRFTTKGFRRVSNSDLVDCMVNHNIPLNGLDRYVRERED